MGKINEILQWLVILLILFLIIGLIIFSALTLPKIGANLISAVTFPWRAEKLIEDIKTCETKADCGYGRTIAKIDNPFGDLGNIIKTEAANQDEISEEFEGCMNKDKITETLEKPFKEECVCISGQCGYIR